MLGAVLGAGTTAAGSALFHEPKEPREWSDRYGNIHDRPLTPEEKKERRQFVARAALIGALGGAGASLGASRLIGKRLGRAERQMAESHLEPFRELISRYKTQAARVAGTGGDIEKRWNRRIRTAEKLYEKQKRKVEELADVTSDRRAGLPFHGGLHSVDSSSFDWRPYSADHLAGKHFDRLAKEQGMSPIFTKAPRTRGGQDAQNVFDQMVTSAMSKTSSPAFLGELEKIARFNVGAAGTGAALLAALSAYGTAADRRQDRMLQDMGVLSDRQVDGRSAARRRRSAALAAAGGLAAGLGYPHLRKRVLEAATENMANAVRPAIEASRSSAEDVAKQSIRAAREEAEELIRDQVRQGQEFLEKNLKSQSEEAGAGFVRGMLNPFRWGKAKKASAAGLEYTDGPSRIPLSRLNFSSSTG